MNDRPPLAIAINAVFLDPQRRGGVETYTRELLAALQRVSSPHRYCVLVPTPTDLDIRHERFDVVPCPINAAQRNRRILWEQAQLPTVLKRLGVDVAHFPYSSYPIRYRGPMVVSIHDTARYTLPGTASRVERVYRDAMESRLARRRAWITNPSEADLDILLRHTNVPRHRATAIYYGLSDTFKSRAIVPRARRRLEVVWVGNPYPHKNLNIVLRAMPILEARLREADAQLPKPTLRLIGLRTAAQVDAVRASAEQMGVDRESLIVERQLAPGEVADRVANAMVLAFPSKYESFGLPTLEALAVGTPAIISDIPAHREIFADAATLVNVDEIGAWAEALSRVMHDVSLWQNRSTSGVVFAGRFSWDSAAQKHIEVYEATARLL